MPLLPLWTYMACFWANLTFTFTWFNLLPWKRWWYCGLAEYCNIFNSHRKKGREGGGEHLLLHKVIELGWVENRGAVAESVNSFGTLWSFASRNEGGERIWPTVSQHPTFPVCLNTGHGRSVVIQSLEAFFSSTQCNFTRREVTQEWDDAVNKWRVPQALVDRYNSSNNSGTWLTFAFATLDYPKRGLLLTEYRTV
jgi:hypothetical protein